MNDQNEKIGVGITTCDRPEYLTSLLNTLTSCKKDIYRLVVINDSKTNKAIECNLPFGTVINNGVNLGVAKSKNKALNYLLSESCDFIFIIEDDMLIKNAGVFKAYIKASKVTGIQHFNYGPGSPFNRKQQIKNFDLHNRHLLNQHTDPNPKLIVDYSHCKISLYQHTVAMFSFFTKKILQEGLGFMPEEYYNAWEHVCSTYSIIKAGYHPPFWAFADIENSHLFLEEAPNAIDNSSISNNHEQWLENVMKGREIYKQKHGHYPNEVKSPTESEVLQSLKLIKLKYSVNN